MKNNSQIESNGIRKASITFGSNHSGTDPRGISSVPVGFRASRCGVLVYGSRLQGALMTSVGDDERSPERALLQYPRKAHV